MPNNSETQSLPSENNTEFKKALHLSGCPICDASERPVCTCEDSSSEKEETTGNIKEIESTSNHTHTSSSSVPSAVEILVFRPNHTIPRDQRGVHENLWIKQRFKQYMSIGVYLDGKNLKYYFFGNCGNHPKIYDSLVELKEDLPNGLENIFENTPKLFVMGHGHGGKYGVANIHGPSEIIHNANFDKIITDFKKALPDLHGEIFVTLEVCNTDNPMQAAREGWEKTFLERLSANHPNMTFCGTGPWDSKDEETGYRSSGGFPTLNAPITSMGGGVWKPGNRVIFYHGNYQVVVKKSMFASTETAKALKRNTIEYAHEVLERNALDNHAIEKWITEIASNRDVLRIQDLEKLPSFPKGQYETQEIIKLVKNEKKILAKEKNNYITRVQNILSRSELEERFTERDILIIALGLKDFSVSRELSIFKDHESLLDEVLSNKNLLKLVMVTCGKVLIAGPSNDDLIDFLLQIGTDINSIDEKGRTALHHAAQGFYNYREEPLRLITTLLDRGANSEAKDEDENTAEMLAIEHRKKGTVTSGDNLSALLKGKTKEPNTRPSDRLKTDFSLTFFGKLKIERELDDAQLEHGQTESCDQTPKQ